MIKGNHKEGGDFMAKHAWLACSHDEYENLGLTPGAPALWEDGFHIAGNAGNYEWWYFDSKLNDGSSLVIVFYPGPMFSFSKGFHPHVTFTHTRADGTKYESRVDAELKDCIFSRDDCEVRVGPCTVKGDLHHYEIFWKDNNIEATVILDGNVPAWRPQSGHILFDNKHYFAWLPSVPEGNITVTIKGKDGEETLTGTGYHDHNWGDVPMFSLMHHWYWGRAKIGDYQVVSSYITAAKKYSYDEVPIFMLAKDGKILADQPEKYLTYSEEDIFFDPITKKHVANKLVYDYDDGAQHYRITYHREGDLEQLGMETQLPGLLYYGALLMGLRGSYHRMVGTATLERFENGEVVETVTNPALWKLMYFGKDRHRP